MKTLYQKIALCSFIVMLFNIQSINAQWTFPYPTTGAPCSSCVPTGWTMVSGSPDISSLANWIGYPHHMSTGVINPVPEPSPGVTTFMSAMAYSSSEVVTTSFTLAAPEVLTVYFGGFGTNTSGGGPAGAMPGMTVNLLVNGASVSVPVPWDGQWHAVTYNLPAGVNTITLDPGIGDDNDRHAVHISIPADQPGTGCTETLNDISTATTICLGEEVTLEATSNSGANITWDGGAINGVPFTPGTAGVVTYTATSDDGNDCPYSTDVTVYDLPNVLADPDVTICTGDSIILNATGATTYVWDIGLQNGEYYTPAATTTINVTGTDLNGCAATDDITITLSPLSVLEAGPNQTICEGELVTLSGSGGTSYSWNNGVLDGVAFSPVSTQIYTVIDVNGCSTSDSITVTVNSNPTIDPGMDATICDGDSILFNATGATTYVWDLGPQNGNYFTPTATTTFTVTGTDLNGCTDSESITITLNPNSIIDAGLDQTICDGDLVTLFGTGGTSYTWNNGVTNGVGFTPTLSQFYTVSDVNGCSESDSVYVTVNALPTIDSGADVAICVGDSVLLNATGAATLNWDFGLQNGDYFSPIVTSTINVTGVDGNGCSSQESLIVTVNQMPAIDAGVDQVLCEGSQITLNATGTGTTSWDNGVVDGVPFTQGDSVQLYVATSVDAIGCQNSDTVMVTMESNPTASFMGDILSGCAPLEVTFTNTTGGNLTDCLWTFENNGTVGDCGNVTMTFENPGYYDVSLTVYSVTGCSNTATYNDYIYIESNPVASFNITSDSISSINPEITLVNTSYGAESYSWNFGDDSPGSTLENVTYLYPEGAAGYVIELIAYSALGCADTAYNFINIVEELIYYIPNTFTPDGNIYNQTFTPVFTSGVDTYDYDLTIYNRWGENLFTSTNPEIGWDGTYGNVLCPDGTYIWRIEFKLIDGDERKIIHGHVNMIR